MGKYADVDATGKLLGFFDTNINKAIPQTAVAITDDQYQDWLANQDAYIWVEDTLVALPSRPSPWHEWMDGEWVVDLETLRQTRIDDVYRKAKARIDALGKMYSSFEAADWTKLEAECRQYLADLAAGVGEPQIGETMRVELNAGSSDTAESLARRVVAKADALRLAKAKITAARRTAVEWLNDQNHTVDELTAYQIQI